MGAPAIVYFGSDECLRVEVLRRAGLEVTHCASVAELMGAIEETPRPDAIVFGEERGKVLDEAVRAAKARTAAARILFQHPWTTSNEREFDLVVQSGTAPERWLEEIARTVVQTRGSALQKPAVAGKGWGEIARELQTMRRRFASAGGECGWAARDLGEMRRIQPGRRKLL